MSGFFQRQLLRFAKETLGRCAADSGHVGAWVFYGSSHRVKEQWTHSEK